MEAHEYDAVRLDRAASGNAYLQFINEGTLSVGLYELAAGSVDTQTPHAEDEVYYIVAGHGTIEVAGERRPVRPRRSPVSKHFLRIGVAPCFETNS